MVRVIWSGVWGGANGRGAVVRGGLQASGMWRGVLKRRAYAAVGPGVVRLGRLSSVALL